MPTCPPCRSSAGDTVLLRTGALDNAGETAVVSAIADAAGVDATQVSPEAVSADWGRDITDQALIALVVFLAAVVLFLAIRFQPKMAVGAIAALVHDIVLTAGIYSLVGFEVTPSTVIGFLTILGFSLYDTVVVFDKVDENVKDLEKGARMTWGEAANLAVNQTLMRSINTSVIALLPVLGLLVVGVGLLGVGTLQDLALVLTVGLAAGTYSSIFLATPVLADLKAREPGVQAWPSGCSPAAPRTPGRAHRRRDRPRRQCTARPAGPVRRRGRRARRAARPARGRRAGRVPGLGHPHGGRPQAGRASPAAARQASVTEPALDELIASIAVDVPDFPEPGVVFRDLTPVFADAGAFRRVVDGLAAPAATDPRVAALRGGCRPGFDVVVGVEARGFLLAAAVALAAGTGVVPVRKAGKLPRERVSADYALEYGSATLELHTDSLTAGQRVLVVDDVLATGGTLEAAVGLVERLGAVVSAVAVVVELPALGGRQRLAPHSVHALWAT